MPGQAGHDGKGDGHDREGAAGREPWLKRKIGFSGTATKNNFSMKQGKRCPVRPDMTGRGPQGDCRSAPAMTGRRLGRRKKKAARGESPS